MVARLEPAITPRPKTGRDKLLAAALDLFSEHGVSGTSLQMIADLLGVTKAAVYYHFKTKNEIVLALVSPVQEELTALADAAEQQRSRTARLDTLVGGLIDLIIRNRSLYAVLQGDLTVAHILDQQGVLPVLGTRLIALLAGPDPEPEELVAANMLLGGLRDAGFAPQIRQFDDETLRGHMLTCARRLLRYRRPQQPAAH